MALETLTNFIENLTLTFLLKTEIKHVLAYKLTRKHSNITSTLWLSLLVKQDLEMIHTL